ncbi:unnamed protein product [Moneuplotes crassus]|uniref:Uncharacterized protein n=1 Tax=Euplotes crassus TaxID=5936 RepID=A0AAD1U8I9_EUPCR|nr:unnamed protein product [Moneuplotes crassus]
MADNPTPMQIVQSAYEKLKEQHQDSPDELQKAVKDTWDIRSSLEDKLEGSIEEFETLQKIPHLNRIESEEDLRQLDGQLVRFSGFIQDMIDQDFFVGFFMTTPGDMGTGIPNKYMQLGDNELEEVEDKAFEYCQQNYTMNRGNLIATSIPNENKWVREKREIENGRFEEVAELLNIKVYDDLLDKFKMNKAYEFIGALEYRPLPKEVREERAQAYAENGYLPPNIIPDMDKYPVLHLMAYLEHPYKNATKFWIDAPELDSDKISELRSKILEVLLEILGGDELAAEYVFMTLLSRVTKREDGIPVGISCINLYSQEERAAEEICRGIERFMKLFQAHTFYAPIDLESLNSYDLIPKKNYDTNRLSRGGLQILNSTCALLDETNMREGKTESERILINMKAIASLVEEQTVRYNFQYHEQSFDCSCATIIVSAGRSIFKNAVAVPVTPTKTPNPDALNDLEEDFINNCRYYFNQVSRRGIEIPDECSNHIQERFVSARQEEDQALKDNEISTKELGANTLHTWLTYSKLKLASSGQTQLTGDIVDTVINLESERSRKVKNIRSASE